MHDGIIRKYARSYTHNIYVDEKYEKSPSSATVVATAMALENTNETWATKVPNIYTAQYYIWKI